LLGKERGNRNHVQTLFAEQVVRQNNATEIKDACSSFPEQESQEDEKYKYLEQLLAHLVVTLDHILRLTA